MIAFAANSLLCRAALSGPIIDAYSFTAIRVLSGALILSLLVRASASKSTESQPARWSSSVALFGYALPFSLAYLVLDTGTGALILFGAVQVTMVTGGLLRGERPTARQLLGLLAAMGGLVYLVAPGVTAPDPVGAATMTVAGVSWGLYSLRGKSSRDPLRSTQQNFARAVPLTLVSLLLAAFGSVALSPTGILLAVTSGAVASGLGYALWYRILPRLTATTAATVQLSVPILAAAAGVLFLDEAVTLRLVVAGTVILGGIALAVVRPRRTAPKS